MKLYAPCASVTVSRLRFVPVLMSVTLAPGTVAALRVVDVADDAAIERLPGSSRQQSGEEENGKNPEQVTRQT